MWIISKSRGLFNVRNISHIYEDGEYTIASNIGGSSVVISNSLIVDQITAALKHGYPFLEVE